MIELVTKFVGWIKDAISLIVGLPGMFVSFIGGFADFLSFLPNGLGTIISGFILTCVTFVIIYAVVKLVTNLL